MINWDISLPKMHPRLDFNFELFQRSLLRLSKQSDILLDLFNVVKSLLGAIGNGGIDVILGQFETRGRPFIEFLRVLSNGFITIPANCLNHISHDARNVNG